MANANNAETYNVQVKSVAVRGAFCDVTIALEVDLTHFITTLDIDLFLIITFFPHAAAAALVAGVGVGLIYAPATDFAVRGVEPADAGVASSRSRPSGGRRTRRDHEAGLVWSACRPNAPLRCARQVDPANLASEAITGRGPVRGTTRALAIAAPITKAMPGKCSWPRPACRACSRR